MDLDRPDTIEFAGFLCFKLIPGFTDMDTLEAQAAYQQFSCVLLPCLQAMPEPGEVRSAEGDKEAYEHAAFMAAVMMLEDQLEARNQDPELAYSMVTEELMAYMRDAVRATCDIFTVMRSEYELHMLEKQVGTTDWDGELRALLAEEDRGGTE